MEAYTTISGTATATIVEKKSEFIANASFAATEEAAQEFLNSIRAQHRTARHNVYAYLLREGGLQLCRRPHKILIKTQQQMPQYSPTPGP